MQILFILSGDSLLNSGVSRVWQAWLVPWAPLWWERKYCLAKIKICDLQFLQPLYCAPYVNELHRYSALSQCNDSSVLRQHHALWQNYGTVTQHNGQTLWRSNNLILPYLQDLVLTLQKKDKSVSAAALRFRQEDVSQNVV